MCPTNSHDRTGNGSTRSNGTGSSPSPSDSPPPPVLPCIIFTDFPDIWETLWEDPRATLLVRKSEGCMVASISTPLCGSQGRQIQTFFSPTPSGKVRSELSRGNGGSNTTGEPK